MALIVNRIVNDLQVPPDAGALDCALPNQFPEE
jgi:hypothetical protein